MEPHLSAVGTDIANPCVFARFMAMCGALGTRDPTGRFLGSAVLGGEISTPYVVGWCPLGRARRPKLSPSCGLVDLALEPFDIRQYLLEGGRRPEEHRPHVAIV